MAAAWDLGVNFFDNAEVYAAGESERIMGEVLKKLAWPRLKYVVSTKFFWGITDGPNEKNTLNRKYLMSAIDGSLKRLQLDHVDLVYCHRPDPDTPIEETVWAMHDMIRQGKALYWGTSEWSASEIMAAWQIAERHHLAKPVVEQPQYNLFHRKRVENEYRHLYDDIGLGPHDLEPARLGAAHRQVPRRQSPRTAAAPSRACSFLVAGLTDATKNAAVGALEFVAKELGCTLAQLAIAWCAKNPHVSSVITGASRVEQVKENLKALEVVPTHHGARPGADRQDRRGARRLAAVPDTVSAPCRHRGSGAPGRLLHDQHVALRVRQDVPRHAPEEEVLGRAADRPCR